MIKPVTFQAAGNFKANLYAAEIKSRFVDQAAAHGFYKGYGAELSATVSGTRIIIGTGAAVICGRMFEVTADETVNVDISGGVVGYVIAHLETYHPADEKNVTFLARTAATLSEIPLIQNDIYAVDADNVNKVYEYPLYSFAIADGAIVNMKREIKGIAEATEVAKKADIATATATTAAATATASDAKATASVTIANNAEATAAEANTKAENAVTTATQSAATAAAADTKADTAITTANGAEATAADANTKADNAVTTAAQAAATAIEANTKADAAVSTADEAKQIAEDAKEGSGTKVTAGGIFIPNFDADTKESAFSVLPVSKGGTGASNFPAGQVLLGGGQAAMQSRAIETTPATDSNALITSGGVKAALDGKEPAFSVLPVSKGGTGLSSVPYNRVVIGGSKDALATLPLDSFVTSTAWGIPKTSAVWSALPEYCTIIRHDYGPFAGGPVPLGTVLKNTYTVTASGAFELGDGSGVSVTVTFVGVAVSVMAEDTNSKITMNVSITSGGVMTATINSYPQYKGLWKPYFTVKTRL